MEMDAWNYGMDEWYYHEGWMNEWYYNEGGMNVRYCKLKRMIRKEYVNWN